MLAIIVKLILIVLSSTILSSLYLKERIENKYIYLNLGFSLVLLILKPDLSYLNLISMLILNALAIIDFKTRIVPDTLTLTLVIINLFINKDNLLNSLVSGLALFIVFYLLAIVMEKIMKKEALGGGDIKLMFPLGMSLGFIYGYIAIVIASVVGLIYYFIRKEDDYIPFVPFIALAWLILL